MEPRDTALERKKKEAKEEYKAARKTYLDNPTQENFTKFCEAKRACMLLGMRI